MTEPKPPKHLTAEAKKFWRRVSSEYELTPDAELILQVAAENWDRAQQARVEVSRDGLTADGRRHPAIDIEKQAYGLFLRAMRQLGLDIDPPRPGAGRPEGS